MGTKVCSRCKVDKPFSEYFRDNKRKIGIRCRCKACSRAETYGWREKNRSEYNNYVAAWRAKNPEKQHASEIKRRYSLSPADYADLLASQRNRCKICEKIHDPTVKRGRLYVDHEHGNGRVRGLLCSACNVAIGYMNDDPSLLNKAASYLSA